MLEGPQFVFELFAADSDGILCERVYAAHHHREDIRVFAQTPTSSPDLLQLNHVLLSRLHFKVLEEPLHVLVSKDGSRAHVVLLGREAAHRRHHHLR